MKICDTCKLPKEESEFNKNKSKKDGLNSICKECSRKRSKLYYKEKGDKHKKDVVNRNRSYRNVLKQFILEYFEKYPCADCGNKDKRVLEFDHLPEFKKDSDISRMVACSVSVDKLKSEIAKCEVVCANCHRIRTYERRKASIAQLVELAPLKGEV